MYVQSYGSGLIAGGDVPDVEASFSDEPDGRNAAVDRQRAKVARERLQVKIARIMDQIRVEQASKEGVCNFIYNMCRVKVRFFVLFLC